MNINEFVWVKLTDRGRAIFKDSHRRHCEPLEADGWSGFQLWVLMELFGAHVGQGAHFPFGTEVRLTDPRADMWSTLRGQPDS